MTDLLIGVGARDAYASKNLAAISLSVVGISVASVSIAVVGVSTIVAAVSVWHAKTTAPFMLLEYLDCSGGFEIPPDSDNWSG